MSDTWYYKLNMKSRLPKRRTIKEIFYSEGFFLQEAVYSCGPTTIQNLQVYFGLPVTPIDEMLKLTKTSTKHGTETCGITEALEALGIQCSKEHTDSSLADLEKALDERCVCIVNYFNAFNEVGHFSLLIGYDEEAYFLVDSSLGFLRLKKKYFEKNWHNHDRTLHKWFVSVCADQITFGS